MAITQELNGELFWQDAQGRLIPKAQVPAADLMRDEMLEETFLKWKEAQEKIKSLKEWVYEEVAAYFDQLQSLYDQTRKLTERATLRSYSGNMKLVIDLQEQITFDERLSIAKSLIDQCIDQWSAGSNQNLVTIIRDAFSVNREGKVSIPRVLGLRKLAIEDETWLKAMQAITDSVTILHSKKYLRFYQRNAKEGKWEAMPLDIAAL